VQTSLPAGVYLFFIFFGATMIVLQLILGLMQVVSEGYAPKIVMVARAHSVSPWTIIQNVVARR
jgi:hypothetical protein